METIIRKIWDHPAIGIIRAILARAIVFYALIVYASNFILDYPRLAFVVKVKNLNKVMPETFRPMLQMLRREPVDGMELARCIAFYREVVRQFPNEADALGMMGFYHFQANELKKAKEFYSKASRRKPEVFWFHFNLGLIEFKEGNYKDAILELEEALNTRAEETLKFISSSGVIYRSLMMEFPQMEQGAQARLDKSRAEAFQLLTLAHFRLKNYESMESVASRALIADVGNRDIFAYYAGLAAYHQKKFDSAASRFAQAIAASPRFPEAHYYLGLAYQALAQEREAKRFLDKATQLFSTEQSPLPIADNITPQIF